MVTLAWSPLVMSCSSSHHLPSTLPLPTCFHHTSNIPAQFQSPACLSTAATALLSLSPGLALARAG